MKRSATGLRGRHWRGRPPRHRSVPRSGEGSGGRVGGGLGVAFLPPKATNPAARLELMLELAAAARSRLLKTFDPKVVGSNGHVSDAAERELRLGEQPGSSPRR